MKIGYVRVSTKEKQNIQMQIDALIKEGVDEENIYIDKGISGSKTNRPQFDAMLDFIRKGDTLIVYKIDRISRSTIHLLKLSEEFQSKGVNLKSLNDPIDTTTPMGRAFFAITAVLSELEKENIRTRVISGLESSRNRGIIGGRPKVDEGIIKEAINLKKQGFTSKQIKEQTGVPKSTLYKYLKVK